MASSKHRSSTHRVVSVRVPEGDFASMVSEADKRNTSVSDVLRMAWLTHQEQLTFQAQLKQMESRLFKRIFEIHCAVDRISTSERSEIINTINQQLQR